MCTLPWRDEPQCFHFLSQSRGVLRDIDAIHGLIGTVVNADRVGGARTYLVELPIGWRHTEHASAAALEIFILEGQLEVEGSILGCGGYVDVPQGTGGVELYSQRGALALVLWTPDRRQFPPPYSAVTVTRTWQEPWVASVPGAHGIMHKSLRRPDFTGHGFDGGPGGYLRLMFVAPGVADPMEHVHYECWEGVFTLAGDILQVNEAVIAHGSYLGHPAGFFHAPIVSHSGCVLLVQTDAPMGFPWPRREYDGGPELVQRYLDGSSWAAIPSHREWISLRDQLGQVAQKHVSVSEGTL